MKQRGGLKALPTFERYKMAEIIKFPSAKLSAYWVRDATNEDNIVCVNTIEGARNIARTLAKEWPDTEFTVEDADENVVFTAEIWPEE